MTTQIEPSVIDAAWDRYVKDIVEAVEAGNLDEDIRKIARACFARRDYLKDHNVAVELQLRRDVLPKNPVPEAGRELEQWEKDILSGKPLDAPEKVDVAPTDTHDSMPRKKSLKGRRRSDPTFRFVDGNLYNRSDVVGRLIGYPDNPAYTLRIDGVGPKAAKVSFVQKDGKRITDPYLVPSKYREVSPQPGGWAVKDPIFMGLAIIRPIINTCAPIKE